jgi:hypothetical protein
MSKLQVFTIKTFNRLNPKWTINVYTPTKAYNGNAIYIPDYTGKDHFPLVKKMSFVNIIDVDLKDYGISINMHNILRSDIFRYYILYKHGGVWSDFDVIWLKPLSHINNIQIVGNVPIQEMGAMVTLFNTTTGHHNIGVLLSVENHPFYKTLIDKTVFIQNNMTGDDKSFGHQEFGSEMWGNMYPDLESITNNFPDVVGFKYETFAPYSIFEIGKLYLETDLSPIENNNVIGVHWFNGHSLSKEYINQNKFGDNSSMTKILKSCGFQYAQTVN